MKVLLIKPYNISDHIQPSLGLGYLATVLKDRHEVDILDCIKQNIWGDKLIEYISISRPDVVGFQMYTYDLYMVKKEINLIKSNFPDVIVVAGGPHPSALPEETLEKMKQGLDFILCGECEASFPGFLDALSKKQKGGFRDLGYDDLKDIEGIAFIREGKVFKNEPRMIQDLDSLKFPAWDIIKPQTYPEAQHGAFFKRFPIAPIMTGRGCPFSCTFCEGHIITGKRVRKRSVGNVIEEIAMLVKDYGIREIHIVDDNFSMYKEYVMEFCESLINRRLDITWATPNGVRIDSLDREMLLAMKASGYYLASVGIEFGSERMLKLTKKALSKDKIRKGVSLIRKAGLNIAGFFMMGYPGETEEEINMTIDFALSLPLIRANFFIFLPLPGTEIYKQLAKADELNGIDWEHFYFTHAAYTTNRLSVMNLRNLQRKAFFLFYLRPSIFIANILRIKTLRQLKFLFIRAYRWLIKT